MSVELSRWRLRRKGRDHLVVEGRDVRKTLCGQAWSEALALPPVGGLLCVDCRRVYAGIWPDPPPGYGSELAEAAV